MLSSMVPSFYVFVDIRAAFAKLTSANESFMCRHALSISSAGCYSFVCRNRRLGEGRKLYK